MKKLLAILGAAAFITAPAAVAADVETTTTTTTTGAGTVSAFTPGSSLVVRTETATEPVSYRLSESVTYVNETGDVIEPATIRSGVPVTVHYSESDGSMVADRVVVRESTTTTTTTTD